MAGKVVNLKQARKAIKRDVAARAGDENAAKFGRSKAQKSLEAARAAKAARELDGHKRDG